jgi:hydroxymethylglutaryl-CoA reductase
MQLVNGFSKLSRSEKLDWLKKEAGLPDRTLELLNDHLHRDPGTQEYYGDLSENTVSNFYLPLGLSPNFLINGKLLALPMVTEESSVVAAASSAAKFWAAHGGFHCRVEDTLRVGQVHFTWTGKPGKLYSVFETNRFQLLKSVSPLTHRMVQRGGGIRSMEIRAADPALPGIYQLFVRFHTGEAMGANFINTVLEALADQLAPMMTRSGSKGELEVLMAILSNYTPESLVSCYVEDRISAFENMGTELSPVQFAGKFKKAVDIANHDPFRAVTHNKGIFNGMDAVTVATGNDFRAVEACGHAYASRKGSYRSLSRVELSDDLFRFTLEVPLAVGTVGGTTGSHPLAAAALEVLGNPSARELMQIIAAAGLATNFSAVRALITTGIQKGHMKMHMGNILRHLNASASEKERIRFHFARRTVSHAEVASYLDLLRKADTENE